MRDMKIPSVEIKLTSEEFYSMFDGYEFYDECGNFLGWVNKKEKCIQKIIITVDDNEIPTNKNKG